MSWECILKSTCFNFGNFIRNWVSLFCTDITSAVNQGGDISGKTQYSEKVQAM